MKVCSNLLKDSFVCTFSRELNNKNTYYTLNVPFLLAFTLLLECCLYTRQLCGLWLAWNFPKRLRYWRECSFAAPPWIYIFRYYYTQRATLFPSTLYIYWTHIRTYTYTYNMIFTKTCGQTFRYLHIIITSRRRTISSINIGAIYVAARQSKSFIYRSVSLRGIVRMWRKRQPATAQWT